MSVLSTLGPKMPQSPVAAFSEFVSHPRCCPHAHRQTGCASSLHVKQTQVRYAVRVHRLNDVAAVVHPTSVPSPGCPFPASLFQLKGWGSGRVRQPLC